MKRLALLALVLLAGCIGTITGGGDDTDATHTSKDGTPSKSGSYIACFDTGYGVKCVQTRTLSGSRDVDSNGTQDPLACATDNDKQDPTSQSSDEGLSVDDNDTSQSSDAPMTHVTDPDDSSADDASGASDSMSNSGEGEGCGDSTSTSTSSESTTCGASDSGDGSDSDADKDSVSDSQDCDCVDPDGPGGGGGGGTPPMAPGEPPLN